MTDKTTPDFSAVEKNDWYEQELRRYGDEAIAKLAAAEAQVDALTKALNGVLWMDNNRANYGGQKWFDFFESVVEDARDALAAGRKDDST